MFNSILFVQFLYLSHKAAGPDRRLANNKKNTIRLVSRNKSIVQAVNKASENKTIHCADYDNVHISGDSSSLVQCFGLQFLDHTPVNKRSIHSLGHI